MANKMLIDATHPEETRVVVLRGNRVEEFDFETAHRKQLRGNIYLAKVTRVEPSLQAAFVEYGGNRHGFLAFSEIHPDYYQIPVADRQALIEADAREAREHDEEDRGNRGGRRPRGRSRHRERPHGRRDESVQSDPLAADGAAHESQPDRVAGPAEFEAGHDHEAHDEVHDAAHDHDHAQIGETENAPVPAEIGTPVVEQHADVQDAEHTEAPYEAAPIGDAPAEGGEHTDSPASESHHEDHNVEDHDGHESQGHDSQGDDSAGHASNGHGPDEEEEIVESVGGADAMEEVPDRAPRYRRQYKIQEVIKRRQVMLVQVVKEERGTKGAALTTYLSLAGRYCVLMPNTARGGGISRKITSADDRKKLREIAEELEVPEGMGVILRTAGAARTKQEVKRDFEYLLRIWEQVRDLTLKSTAPTLVYEEGSLAKRSIRDLYSKDIDEIVVAGDQGYRDAKDFMRMLMPSHAKNVKHYADTQPVFTRYGIEGQLDAMFSPTVQLRSGGYIVINQTEALVAIDVNSGRSTREHHIEDTALKTNCEAAEEVARQLRLRDLAGLIVIDFIDMDEKRNNRTVERRMKDALRNDRARIQVGRISHFGLLEMSRQRIRTSVLESSTEKCPHCGGTGHVRSVSSVALQLLRAIEEMLLKGPTHSLIIRTRPEIALYVLNHKRAHLSGLEERFRVSLTVNADEEVAGQAGFVIDRGEQVMTPEQARALLSQIAESTPLLIEEEEPESTEVFDEETEAESSEAEHSEHEHHGEHAEHGIEAEHAEPSQGENDHEGGEPRGRGRRRRRRGRGGRGGEGGQFQPRNEQGTSESGEFAPDQAQGFAPAAGGEFAPGQMPAEQGFDQPRPEGGEAQGNGRDDGNGGPRRRRGRRGGRRNRRDREGAPGNGEFAASQGQETHESSHDARPDWSPPHETSAPQSVESGQEPDREQRFEARPEPAPSPAAVATPAPAAEAPRRRSTVREAAPIFGSSSTPVTPPAPQPEPPPAVASSAEASESKPKRSGWWAKRLLGGD